MDDSELNQHQSLEDLSITLLERRKRLHVLATEINNWENEAHKNPNYLQTLSTPPQHVSAPSTSILSFDRSTPTQNSFYSPKNFNKSPAPMIKSSPQYNNNATNKENVAKQSGPSPSKRKLAETPVSASSLSSSEILNVAHRILNKKQSNSAMCPKVPKIDKPESESLSAGAVKNARSRFENMGNSDNNSRRSDAVDSVMTPRSIIKKFEQMSRDTSAGSGSHSNPISAQSSQTSLTNKTSTASLGSATSYKKPVVPEVSEEKHVPSIFPSLKHIDNHNAESSHTIPRSSNNIYSEHINPKSIIHKFEQLVKNNARESENAEMVPENTGIPKSVSCTTNMSSATDPTRCSGSLTYISSVVSETSPRDFNDDDDDEEDDDSDAEEVESEDSEDTDEDDVDINEETYQGNHTETDELYEELGPGKTIARKDQNDCDNTSLFEEETATTTDNGETYSLSSAYSGSCINKEFDDIETDQATEIYSEYTEAEQTYDDYQIESTKYSPGPEEFNEHANVEATEPVFKAREKSILPPLPSGSNDEQCSEPLFSIKEYRKQKKHAISGGYRRSSVATGMRNKDLVNSAEKQKRPTPKKTDTQAAANSDEDINIKKNRYLERIKELEEMIKQEDNIIHQTGIALERCLTDTLFTGSSEHIECNRILLISCQKRQAYSSEIGRLKQLIKILVDKKPVQPVVPAIIDEFAGYADMNQVDLTGLLIFSDLQLPIKESYLNKLKSGDEKRIFYFLCLIRNGIQVLQTQVISVQELIATRDTSITFPNRMAISNVDVNFKVKIDIYTLEITPKEIKNSKSSVSTSKFFSPFKNSLGMFSSHSDNSTASSNHSSSHSNHHYNEQLSLGVSTGGAKTSNFIHIDTVEITNKDLSSNRFKLSISSSSIPLTGVLFVTVRCMPSKSIELKGFMTLLEDVNGMRSWDRRWCFLNNYNISYWKYPEDEYKTSPIGIINLTKCVNDKVSILPRDICARKYTFELAIGDDSTTTSEQQDNCVRYRLSADTKDQANDWLTNVNYALANLKLWNPKSNKSIKK